MGQIKERTSTDATNAGCSKAMCVPEDAQVPLCRGTPRTCRALGRPAPLLDAGRAICAASLCALEIFGGSGEGCLWACWCCAFRKTAKPAGSRTSPWWLWCNARVRVGTSASDRRGSVSSRSPIFDFPLAPYASRRLVMASPHAAPKASAADLAADFFEAADLTWASEPPAAPGPTSTSTPMASSPMEVEQPVVGDLGVRNRSRPRRARGSWEVSNLSQQRRRLRWANRI